MRRYAERVGGGWGGISGGVMVGGVCHYPWSKNAGFGVGGERRGGSNTITAPPPWGVWGGSNWGVWDGPNWGV